MDKIRKVFSAHKYMFGFFFLILLAQFIGNGDTICFGDEASYSFHVVDFRVGIVSRILPGQLYLLLFKNPSRKSYVIYEYVLLVLVLFCVSYFLEKIYSSAPDAQKITYAYILGLFCVSGCVFHIFFTNVGMLDVYWIYSLVLFFLLLQNKKTWFLIPLCYVFMVFVNYGALLCYIPLMSIVLLFKASYSENKEEKKYIVYVFFVSVFLTIATFSILSYNEEHNIRCSAEQFHRILSERGSNYYTYYDYSLFRGVDVYYAGNKYMLENFNLIKSEAVPDFIRLSINKIATQVYLIFMRYFDSNIFKEKYLVQSAAALLSGIPVFVVFFRCLIKLFRSCDSKLKKFAAFCAIALFPFSYICYIFFTGDIYRFFCHSFICIFLCFLYLLYKDKKVFGNIVYTVFEKKKSNSLLLYMVIAFITRFYPFIK